MSYNILFVCATGIATSTAVAEKVIEFCKGKGVDINYSQTNVASLSNDVDDGVDLVISTTKVPYSLKVPMISGLPIITGIGEEEVLEKILSVLNRK